MRLRLGEVDHDLTTRPLVMGTVDPPLSSLGADGGSSLDSFVGRAEQLVAEGADLLDLGGVLAGSGPSVGEEEELERVVTAVQAVRSRFDVPLSVDTWRSRVLAASCAAGATVARDATGFADPAYLPAAAAAGAVVVVASTRLPSPPDDIVAHRRSFLAEQVTRANAAGLGDERIIVDPGLDLGKTPAQLLALLQGSAALADIGPPLLVGGAGRGLGMLLGLDAGERRMAGHAAAALGVARGCRIVLTDDVKGARRVAAVLEALLAARLAHVRGGIDA